MSHRKMLLSVGFFILFSSLIIILALLYLIDKKGIFETQKQYQLIAKDAQNIEKGMPVLFSGFEIGHVSDLGLHDNGEVLVTISIPQHNTKWVRIDSIFSLENPLIGKPKLTLSSNMKSPLFSGDIVLRMHINDGINEIITNIQPVILELQEIVSNVHTLSSSLADANASFQRSLQHTEQFSSKLVNSPDLLSSVTGNTKSAKELDEVISKLKHLLQAMQKMIENTDGGVSELRKDIIQPASKNIQVLDAILRDIRQKLQALDKTVKTLGNSDEEIEYFKDEMSNLIDEMNELSDRVNDMIGEPSSENIELP